MAVLPASAGPRPTYEIDEDARAALLAAIDEEGVTTLDGELDGAFWVAQVPDDWNGDLAVWAHGHRGEGARGLQHRGLRRSRSRPGADDQWAGPHRPSDAADGRAPRDPRPV